MRVANLLGGEFADELLSELLGAAAEWDRPQARERCRRRRDATQEVVGALVVVAARPAVAGDDLWVRLPDAFDDRIRGAVRVVGAEHPRRQVLEGAVEYRLISGPYVPLVGIRPELDVGHCAQRGGLPQLFNVDLVVGG